MTNWLKRLFSPSPRLWIDVQFEPDGKIYTFHRTMNDFKEWIEDRFTERGDFPYKAWIVSDQGTERTEISFGTDEQ